MMNRSPRPFLALFLPLLAVLLLPAAPLGQGTHRDPRIGFQIKPPRGWNEVPVPAGEQWIVAQYQAGKDDHYYDKVHGSSWVLKPRLIVVAMLDELIQKADVEEEEDSGDRKIRLGPVYRDYAEFAEAYYKRVYRLGYYEAAAEEGEVDGMAVRRMQLSCDSAGRAVIRAKTWIFETEIGDVAVQLECFADSFDKYEKDFERCLGSFKRIERTEPLNLDATPSSYVSILEIFALTPEDRRLRREERERLDWAAMTAEIPDGWEAHEIDGVRILTHEDKNHARKVAAHINAVQAWLEETFPSVGPGEYTRKPLVRICSHRDEAALFQAGTGGEAATSLVTYKDTSAGAMSTQWGSVGRGTKNLWFFDRDVRLWFNQPPWLSIGLDRVMDTATLRGRKLDFDPDWFERALKDELRNDGDRPATARQLLGFSGNDKGWDVRRVYESFRLVRMLVTTRDRNYRDLLTDYLRHLDDVLDEMDAEEDDEDPLKKPENEEEEEAYFAERRKRAEAREARLLEEVASRTFAGWSEKDWKDFESAFEKFK